MLKIRKCAEKRCRKDLIRFFVMLTNNHLTSFSGKDILFFLLGWLSFKTPLRRVLAS